MPSILIRNIYHLQQAWDLAPQKGVDLMIRDERIEKIAPQITESADRVIDASTLVVIPGLVNTHHHFYQTLTRNLPAVQNAGLFSWLKYLYPIWANLDEEAVLTSSRLAIGELLKTGCTLSTDHHYLYPRKISADIPGLQFSAAEELGIRFCPTRGSMSLSKKDGGLPPDSVVQTDQEILRDSERTINEFHDSSPDSMRKVSLAPCSPFSVTRELLRETARLGRKHGVRLHTHLAETEDENTFCEKTYGKRPLELMEDCEFIGKDVFYAHGIWFNDGELDRLAETGSMVAHCPSSNMRLGSGICRMKEMKERGMVVGLAVDGSASNDSSDMLGEMSQALFLQRIRYGASSTTALDILRIATEGGARLLDFPGCGRLEPGMAADLALFDLDKLEYCGSHSDPFGALLFSGYNHGTAYTIVNGRVVVDQGRLTGLDEEKLKEQANRCSAALLKNI